ncbi:hypothetical protein BST61_g10478 [Cercospora zeina]
MEGKETEQEEYDRVIVFLASPTQRVATKFYQGLWTISQVPKCILAFDDWQVGRIWKEMGKIAGRRGQGCEGREGYEEEKEKEKLFGDFVLKDVNNKTREQVRPYERELRRGLEVILQKGNRVLVPGFSVEHVLCFGAEAPSSSFSSSSLALGRGKGLREEEFGAHLLFGGANEIGYPRERIFVVNPNPYHRNRTWEDAGHEGWESPEWRDGGKFIISGGKEEVAAERPKKRRRLNYASLAHSQTKAWLKRQCGGGEGRRVARAKITAALQGSPVVGKPELKPTTKYGIPSHIGNWPLDLYGARLEPEKRLTEDEMVKVFTRDWACMMPKYEHSGSGWWRARPLQCADAGSVLIGDDKELAVLYGWGYPFFGRTASDVVKLSDDELEEMARVQRKLLYATHPLYKSVQRAEVAAVLRAPE